MSNRNNYGPGHGWVLFTLILAFTCMGAGMWLGKEVSKNHVTNLGDCHYVGLEKRIIGGWSLVPDPDYYFYACSKKPEDPEIK